MPKLKKIKSEELGFSMLHILLATVVVLVLVLIGIRVHDSVQNKRVESNTAKKSDIIYNFQPPKMQYTLPKGWTTTDTPDIAWNFNMNFNSPTKVTLPQYCPDLLASGNATNGGCYYPRGQASILNVTNYSNPNVAELTYYSTLSPEKIGNQTTYCNNGQSAKKAPNNLPSSIPSGLYTQSDCFVIWENEEYDFSLTVNNPTDNAGLYALVGSINFVQ